MKTSKIKTTKHFDINAENNIKRKSIFRTQRDFKKIFLDKTNEKKLDYISSLLLFHENCNSNIILIFDFIFRLQRFYYQPFLPRKLLSK